MNNGLTKWVAGIGASLVVVILVAGWTALGTLTSVVSDLKVTNAEIRGAIERLGDRLLDANTITKLNLDVLERKVKSQENRVDSLEERLRSLERAARPGLP